MNLYLLRRLAILCLLLSGSVKAADVYLMGNNSLNASSFYSSTDWQLANGFPAGAAPSAGNHYHLNGHYLRTPTAGATHFFAGSRLTIGSQVHPSPNTGAPGALLLAGAADGLFQTVVTVGDLVVEGGFVSHFGRGDVNQHLAGQMRVTPHGGVLWTHNGSLIIESTLVLEGALQLWGNHANRYHAFAGDVAFRQGGAIVFSEVDPKWSTSDENHLQLFQREESTFTFTLAGLTSPAIVLPETVGERTLSATFNGQFAFDPEGLSLHAGLEWTIISNPADVSVIYGSNFSIDGFSFLEDGLWTSDDGAFFYDQQRHLLMATIPEPSTLALGAFAAMALFWTRRRRHYL